MNTKKNSSRSISLRIQSENAKVPIFISRIIDKDLDSSKRKTFQVSTNKLTIYNHHD